MDRVLIKLIAFSEAVAQILIKVLRQEWCDRSHQLGHTEKDVKQNGQGLSLVLDCGLALHTCAIESHIPIGQILQEGQKVAHDIVQAVIIHFVTDALDHMLRCCDNVLVQIVGILALENLLAHSWVEDERLVSALLKSRDVLDAESVGVEPWEEDVSHDGLDAVP